MFTINYDIQDFENPPKRVPTLAKIFIIFFILAIIAVGITVPILTKAEDSTTETPKCDALTIGKIFKGDIAGSLPFVVKLKAVINVDNKRKALVCSGSILNKQWILTAAHCVHNSQDITVLIGDKSFKISTIKIHHLYTPSDRSYDLAALKLISIIELDKETASITINPKEKNLGEKVSLAGYGQTENGKLSDQLRKVETKIQHETCCSIGEEFTNRLSCAGSPSGGVCFGDSGGPVYIKQNDKFYLYGIIVTSALTNDNRCNGFGGFAKLSFFNEWVSRTISNK
ncbi:hypothetical protein SNEBB_003458 [Seison nebaliae]|nr:hypothetical protein SNEBB_003458 [Seison nebaliae]